MYGLVSLLSLILIDCVCDEVEFFLACGESARYEMSVLASHVVLNLLSVLVVTIRVEPCVLHSDRPQAEILGVSICGWFGVVNESVYLNLHRCWLRLNMEPCWGRIPNMATCWVRKIVVFPTWGHACPIMLRDHVGSLL